MPCTMRYNCFKETLRGHLSKLVKCSLTRRRSGVRLSRPWTTCGESLFIMVMLLIDPRFTHYCWRYALKYGNPNLPRVSCSLFSATQIFNVDGLFVCQVLKSVNNLRSSVSKNALLCLGDLFRGLGRRMDTEIATVLPDLLKRCADTNKFVNAEALKVRGGLIDSRCFVS